MFNTSPNSLSPQLLCEVCSFTVAPQVEGLSKSAWT